MCTQRIIFRFIGFVVFVMTLFTLLAGCGAGSGGDASGCSKEHVDEGSLESRLDLTGKIPYCGSVSYDGSSYYTISGLDPTVTYTVELVGEEVPVNLSVSPGAVGSEYWATHDCNSDGYIECGVGGADYLNISVYDRGEEFYNVGGNNNGSDFTLRVYADGGNVPEGEGSIEAPLDISDLTPYDGRAVFINPSFYVINGLTSGVVYEVHVTPNDSSSGALRIYNSSAFETITCETEFGFRGKNICTTQALDGGAGGGVIYFDYRSSTNTTLTIDYEVAPVTEGTVDSPSMLDFETDFPYAGEVGSDSNSYYQFTGLTPFEFYKAYVTTVDRTAWKVYWRDTAETTLCGATGIGSEQYYCIFEAPADSLINNIVYNTGSSNGYRFELRIEPYTQPVAEGAKLDPVDITSLMPHQAQILADDGSRDEANRSYYKVTGLAPSSPATISISEMENTIEAMWGVVYEDAAYSTEVTKTDTSVTINCQRYWDNSTNSTCTVNVPASGELYFEYYEYDTLYNLNTEGGYFIINVTQK